MGKKQKAPCRDWDYPERYLADISSALFHDLANPNSRCNIVNIIDQRQDIPYKYKTEAKRDGYSPCPYCMPDKA